MGHVPAVSMLNGLSAPKPTDANVATKAATTPKSGKSAPGGLPSTPLPAGLEAVKGEVSIMIPEKINRCKLLVELENKQNPEGVSSTDLSGDAGAVGRLIVSSSEDGKQDVHVDLKGVLYSATLVPTPGTLCVLSVGPSEAKVEGIVTAFAQLREESTFAMAEAVMEGDLSFMDADEDDYTVPSQDNFGAATLGAKPAGKKAGPGKPKAKSKSKPGTGKAAKPKTAKPKSKVAAAKGSAKGGLGAAKKSAGVRKKK
ncbi:uncharacterized protein LOC142357640 [Convolutriloba macropyga]|uniref:uncharacterized protein LOC142357640 n=1 Tax=Convolutriloba macropyga TaxID=536237 RepID=UPI003F51F49C